MQQAEQTAPRKRALNQWLSVISKPKVFFVSKKRLSSAKPNFNESHREGAARNSRRRGGPKPACRKPAFGAPDRRKTRRNRGQGLIEYLILTALMGVAAIAIIRTLNQTVKSRFANVIYALQGKNQKAKTHSLKKEEYQRSDLSNFMSGAADRKKEKK